MAKPFLVLSYRRDDAPGMAGRIYDRLSAHFGQDSVFMDLDSIPYGVDFREDLQQALARCDVLLAVIGRHWAGDTARGPRRIDDPKDFVRIEVEAALQRGIPIIPVLVDGASMPQERDPPGSLARLAYRNAIAVSHGRDFDQHIDRLMRGIDRLAGTAESEAGTGTAPSDSAGRATGAPIGLTTRIRTWLQGSESKSAKNRVITDGTSVLLGPYYLLAQAVRSNEDGTLTVVVPPAGGQDKARLMSLRPDPFGVGPPVPFAVNDEAGVARVQAVGSERAGGRRIWTVTLAPEEVPPVGLINERVFNTVISNYSADDIARLRARRILLDDPPPLSNGGRGPGIDRFVESLIRLPDGPCEIQESPIRRVHAEQGSNPNWKHFARLRAVYALKTTRTVDQILELSLGAVKPDGLPVRFRGTRAGEEGQEPATIDIAGVCPLG